jgi:hypothetical protein
LVIYLLWLFTAFIPAAEENKPKDDPQKDLYFVEKTEPVPEKMKPGFDSITAADAESYLRFLSSDLLEGRDTCSPGYNIAAEFAAALFRLWGLQPAGDFPPRKRPNPYDLLKTPDKKPNPTRTYFQDVFMKEFFDNDFSITGYYREKSSSQLKTFQPDIDYISPYEIPGNFEEITASVVFVGYGISEKSIDFDEYQGLDVKGKIVLMFGGLPRDEQEDSPFKKGKLKEKYYPDLQQRFRQGWVDPKQKLAEEKGALAVLEVSSSAKGGSIAQTTRMWETINDEEPIIPGEERSLSLLDNQPYWSWDRLPQLWISYQMADQILAFADNRDHDSLEALAKKIDKDLKPRSRHLDGVSIAIKNRFKTKLVRCLNVLGFIEGSDPELKKEVVVIGAHLDHLGKRGDYIFNGADDNGSGSAAVLELAQAFALNPVKPKRSILFALWTGEEKGMLGSRFYADNPYYPLEKTLAYLNADTIGRAWEKDFFINSFKRRNIILPEETLKKIDFSNFLTPSLAEDSPYLYETVKNCGRCLGITLLLRKSGGNVGGSDFVPFARKKIPWTHISSGGSKELHQPGDSIDKIDFEIIRKVSQLLYTIAFTVSDQ